VSATARLIAARALRGFADGLVSVVLPTHLALLGFAAQDVGALVTTALVGSALLTLGVGLWGARLAPRRVLLAATALFAATGLGFAGFESAALLFAVAFVGTMNPTAGDLSIFLPIEIALLGSEGDVRRRTTIYARYAVAGAVAGALGSLAVGLPQLAMTRFGVTEPSALRACFLVYAAFAPLLAWIYGGLGAEADAPARDASAPRAPLARSRRVVLQLSALFGLDSFGGGFAVQSMLALWLFQRFGLSLAEAGSFFFGASLLGAAGPLFSPRLAARIGQVETMVYTHIPANGLLIAAAFMPSAPLALACLLARSSISQMDVPARQSYVIAVVPPEERTAATSVTNVPRSLAGALSPALAGWMLAHSSFGWPLVAAGALKIVYDLILLAMFRSVRPGEPARA
jgi:MFS family permease